MYNNRVKTTVSCRDTDYIPKVENAGQVEKKNGIKYQIMHNGTKMIYGGYHGEWMATIIRELHGHHEPQEEKAFYEILKYLPEGGTMIELGSNWSYYSIWFNHSIKNAKNYMIEPIKDKLEVGKNNFALNGMQGEFLNAFVGSKSLDNEIFVAWDGKEITLPKICIDDYVEQQKIRHIDVLHSDIQGEELDMLHGCKKNLASHKISFLVISTHCGKHNSCRRYIEKHGYAIIASHTPEESFSADGLLVACSPKISGVNEIYLTRRKPNSLVLLHKCIVAIKKLFTGN